MTPKETPQDESQGHSRPEQAIHVEGQEYRLIPAHTAWGSQPYDDEIDLMELAKTLWESRITIVLFTLLGAAIGVFIALMTPKEYTVTATLMPELGQSSEGGASSLLRRFGGLAGVSAADLSSGSGEGIPVTLYPEIVQTLPFQMDVLNQSFLIPGTDQEATLQTYFLEMYEPRGFEVPKQWIANLTSAMLGMFLQGDNSQSLPMLQDGEQIVALTKDQNAVIGQLDTRIRASLNDQTGIIETTVTMPDPVLSARVADYVIRQLTEYLTQYRLEKVTQDLEFVQGQLVEAEQRYETAWLELTEFREQSQGSITARARKGEQFLEAEYNNAVSIFQSLSQQYEQKKIEVQEKTPIFNVLQPARVPIQDDTSGSLIVALSTILMMLLSFGIVLVQQWFTHRS